MPAETAAAGTTAAATTSTTSTLLVLASIAAATASATIAARSTQQQSKSASAIAQFNAETSKEQAAEKAERLKVEGRVKQERILEQRRRILALNRAKLGKSGVTFEGSPLLVQQEVARNITQDAVMENFNTQIGVQGTLTRGQSEAQLSLLKGESARKAGKLQVGQALFSGASQIASIGLETQRAKRTA